MTMSLEDPANFLPVETCGLCGGAERRERFREGPFEVVECAACGLVYVQPRLRPDVLARVYDRDYWESACPSERGYADYVQDAELYLKTFRKRLNFLERFVAGPGRALDVGCAAGFFLRVLRERGWEGHGVELSPAIAAHAQEAELDVHVGELGSANFEPGSFPLITLWDVVEHVPDPVALLRQAADLLAPEGRLVVETQNVASPFARLLGPRWQHYKHLEHLYHFRPETVSSLLERAGLEVVHRTWRFAGKYVSLGFIRERAVRLHPVMATLLRPFAFLDALALYVNPGDEMIVIARKRRAT